MSRSELIPPACLSSAGATSDEDLLRPGDRVKVQVRSHRPRQAAEVVAVERLGRGRIYVLVRLVDGQELVRSHAECWRTEWQPKRK